MTRTHKRYVYVAGPLFSESEREHDEKIARVCEDLGYETFLPHRDAGLEIEGNAAEIYQADLRALEKAAFVVANLDGHDVDAGTAWEIGYAVALKTPIFGVRTDRRVLEPWANVNLMIGQSVRIVDSIDALRECLLDRQQVSLREVEDRNQSWRVMVDHAERVLREAPRCNDPRPDDRYNRCALPVGHGGDEHNDGDRYRWKREAVR